MIKIYARSTDIGKHAYSAVAKCLGFAEKAYDAEGFLENIIEIDDLRTASFILDGHTGSGDAEIYIHATENGRMPSGLVRAAFQSDSVLLETNHGKSAGDQEEILNEAYLEVKRAEDAYRIVKIINDFIGSREPPKEKYFYTAIKDNGLQIKKELFEVSLKPTVIITERQRHGVPLFIESGINALRNAVYDYNLDIQGVGSPDEIAISDANSYLFQYSRDAKKNKHLLNTEGISYLFAMNHGKSMVTPQCFDDPEKEAILTGARNLPNKIAGKYDESTIRDMQTSIIINMLAGKAKEARQLIHLFSEEGRRTIPRLH